MSDAGRDTPVRPSRIRAQRGQAVIGVLVALTVLFALAGAVTIGALALLRQQTGSHNANTDDFAAVSAATDAASLVAGSRTRCTLTSAATFARTTTPTPLPIRFPNVTTDVAASAYCSRLDGVAVSSLSTNLYLTPTWSANNCTAMPLPAVDAGVQRAWVFFDARWSTAGYAYVDGSGAQSCSRTPPSPKASDCLGTTPSASCIRCGQAIDPGGQVVQVTLDCDVSDVGGGQLYLHAANPGAAAGQLPPRVFFAAQDPTGGSLYVMVADTTGRPGPAYQEVLLFVGPNGSPNQLLYRAPLP